jgi:5,10-methylenetetrahydrofolate reductase
MRAASEKGAEHEKAEGLAIARELAAGIRGLARGLHIMPMGRYKVAAEILESLAVRAEGAAPGGKQGRASGVL